MNSRIRSSIEPAGTDQSNPDIRHPHPLAQHFGGDSQVPEGKIQGKPALVHRNIGRLYPLGYSQNGNIYFSREYFAQDVYYASLDWESGRLLSKPVRIDPSHNGSTSHPAWSPDGKQIAFLCGVADGRHGQDFTNSLCIKSLEDGQIRKLDLEVSIYTGYDLTWSRDGKEIHARGINAEKQSTVWRIDADSGRLNGPTPRTVGAGFRALYDRNTRIPRVVYQDAQGKQTEIYRGQLGERPRLRAENSDQSLIAVEMQSADTKVPDMVHLVLVHRDGTESRELGAFTTPGRPSWIRFAPGDRYLVTSLGTGDRNIRELWKIPLDGSKRQKLEIPASVIHPLAFHPDGKQLTYVDYQAGGMEIWVYENAASASISNPKARTGKNP